MKGWLTTLSFLLFVGTASASHAIVFRQLMLPDGETPSDSDGGDYHPRLILQEGAVVDIICKSYKPARYGPPSDAGFKWFLGNGGYQGGNYHRADHLVDPKTFPAERNFEKYHSNLLSGSSFEKRNFARPLSTLRYTARMEDHGKYLGCEGEDLNSGSYPDVSSASYVGNHLHLVIRPAPAPLRYKSTVAHKWRGGFVGKIDIPISEYYTAWKIVINFRRKVYELYGSPFQVANEPCLHTNDCGDDAKKTWVIYNTFANHVQNPGDKLSLTFVAKVWKKIDLGIKADVDFYGFNQVFFTDVSSADGDISSSSDIHVM